MTQKGNATELGTQPIGKLLMQYAIPAIIAMTASSLYNTDPKYCHVHTSVNTVDCYYSCLKQLHTLAATHKDVRWYTVFSEVQETICLLALP